MSIINTFYMLFKNDARSAAGDIAVLEKQIDQLKDKGKKRSEQENKDLKESIARHKELKKETEEQNRQVEKLIEGVTTLGAAYVSLSSIKASITNTADFNRALSVQSKNLGQNTTELRAYSAAIKQLGGDDNAFRSFVESKTIEANQRGLPFDMKKYVANLRQLIHSTDENGNPMSAENQRAILSMQGVPVNQFELYQMSQEKYDTLIQKNEEFSAANEKSYETARKFGTSLDQLGETQTTFWGQIGEGLLPTIKTYIDDLTSLINTLNKGGLGKVAGRAAGGTVNAVFDSLIPGGGVVRAVRNYFRSPEEKSTAANGATDTGGDDMAFWMGKGYTREQAAVIIATQHHESGGNPNARGDGGLAHGLIQWHPDRRRAILAGTGIDVSSADKDQQREALAWEMKNIQRRGWSDDSFRGMTDINQLSSYYTGRYVSPADIGGESFKRAQTALNIAGSYTPGDVSSGGGSKSMSVKIDEMNVQTQATDAHGLAQAFSSALENELRTTVGQMDDAEAY